MSLGKLIVLNGTSSSGKTSVLKDLQKKLKEPYLNAGIDKFLYMLPESYFKQPLWNEIMGKSNSAGELGNQLISGMHYAMKSMVERGNFVLADHVVIEPSWAREMADLFKDIPAYLIGVRCQLEIIEKRELERKDRTLGSARLQFDVVHKYLKYDLEIDTSNISPEEGADQIMNFLAKGIQPKAFREIFNSPTAY